MSWGEVIKINSNIKKPLNTLIVEAQEFIKKEINNQQTLLPSDNAIVSFANKTISVANSNGFVDFYYFTPFHSGVVKIKGTIRGNREFEEDAIFKIYTTDGTFSQEVDASIQMYDQEKEFYFTANVIANQRMVIGVEYTTKEPASMNVIFSNFQICADVVDRALVDYGNVEE